MIAASAQAETVTYSYDALGRLVASAYVGGPRNAKSATLSYDPAGNRSVYGFGATGLGLAPTGSDERPAVTAASPRTPVHAHQASASAEPSPPVGQAASPAAAAPTTSTPHD
jgi:hypothetical protein